MNKYGLWNIRYEIGLCWKDWYFYPSQPGFLLHPIALLIYSDWKTAAEFQSSYVLSIENEKSFDIDTMWHICIWISILSC